MRLADGRVVAFVDGGDPGGYPVFGLHGTPGCRLARVSDDQVYADTHVRYITTDRAGYGQSSRHYGRVVADEASDIREVADGLGIERFAVVGGSGGGPHALACAALLAGRVERVACQSSVAPIGVGGMTRGEWLAGMAAEHAVELEWAEAGEEILVRETVAAQQRMAEQIVADPANVLGEEMSESDRAFLLRPEVAERFALVIAEQAAHGVGGWVDDTLAFIRPWGFDLDAISVPVLLTHGAHDKSAPLNHGLWLAERIPAVETRISETGGHLPEDHATEIADTMRWLCG